MSLHTPLLPLAVAREQRRVELEDARRAAADAGDALRTAENNVLKARDAAASAALAVQNAEVEYKAAKTEVYAAAYSAPKPRLVLRYAGTDELHVKAMVMPTGRVLVHGFGGWFHVGDVINGRFTAGNMQQGQPKRYSLFDQYYCINK